jgi:hypothetical protein
MSKNLTRKGLALGTTLALSITGLVGIAAPASAADGDVISIAPTTGTGWAAYNTDYLNVDVTVDTDVVTSTAYDKLAVRITAADSGVVSVKLSDGLAQGVHAEAAQDTCTYTLPARFVTDLGVALSQPTQITGVVNVADATTGNADCTDAVGASAVFSVDFTRTAVKYTSAVINLTGVAAANAVTVSLKANDGATATDHKNRVVGLFAFLDSDDSNSYSAAADKYPSTAETLTFYDAANVSVTPRIERFLTDANTPVLNAAGGQLGGSLQFSPELNLDQIDLSNIVLDSSDADVDTFVPQYRVNTESHSESGRIYGLFADNAGTVTGGAGTATVAGNSYDTYNVAPTAAAIAVDVAVTVTVKVSNADAAGTGTKDTTSPGYTVPKQATAGITADAGATVDLKNDSIQANKTTTAIKLRSGVKTFTYTGEGTYADGAVASNVPVLVHVTANGIGATSTIKVGGQTLSKGDAILVSGVTGSTGKFSVTVESATALAGETYSVNFHFLANNGTWLNNVAAFTPTYEAAAGDKISAVSTIISGDNATASFKLVDQFGSVVSANASGTAYVVRVQASNTANLKQYLTVVNGAASVTFKNYLSKGQSDSITAQVGTGTTDSTFASASLTTTSSVSVTLYNSEAAAGITVSTPAAGVVTYDDFITGTPSSTNVAPTSAQGTALTGTVVDVTGVGIPGASVTVSAKGVQFAKSASGTPSGDYYMDTITVSADAAGSFEVKMWTHLASATGTAVTVTAGGKTATATWKTYLPENLSAGNLNLTWSLPAAFVKDTTYAVTAKLADKWGNPVRTYTNGGVLGVTFQGFGSVTVNSVDTEVNKNFDAKGEATVFVRSVKDVVGPGSLSATVNAATYRYGATPTDDTLIIAPVASDSAATKWNETTFTGGLEANIEVVTSAPAGAKVNVGSFNGKLVVYANGYNGKRISWKVGGRWGSAVAASNTARFDRPTPRRGVDVVVEIYVDGKLELTKTVRTR